MSDEIHALSGAYAVDALDEMERARFERHLGECSACRAEVESLTYAAVELSAITETVPPSSLRVRVLSDIRTVRPLPPLTADPNPPAAHTEPDVPADPLGVGERSAGPDTDLSRRAARRSADQTRAGRSPWRGLVAAAAAAVLAVGSFSVWRTLDDNQPAQEPAATQVMQAPDAARTERTFANGGSATIVRSASLRKAVLVASDLPAPPEGKTYQLWWQSKQGRFISAGVVPGAGDQVVVMNGDAASAAGAGITVEPVGGSQQPTTKPLALFPFSA